MSVTSERKFFVGDVWLCSWSVKDLIELRIKEIAKGHVRHDYGWSTVQEWNDMAQTRLGKARFFLGIYLGYKR